MAILGVFTSVGIEKSREASLDLGFQIIPTSFGVSRDAGALSPALTGPNSGQWFVSPISSRENVSYNTVKIICTVPPHAIPNTDEIKEIYIYAKDTNDDDFVLAYGQPSDVITYDTEGTVTLELQLSLVDIDLTANYIFQNTKQTELDEHLNAPDAHPEFAEAMAKAGIFIPMGMYSYEKVGQAFDEGEHVEFDGTKANATYGGLLLTSRFNGDDLNSETIEFDGVKTIDEVITEFNNSHGDFTVEHNGNGSEVLAQGSATLLGGTYLVEQKDLVYLDTDGIYKSALADGTIKSNIAGMAYLSDKLVRGLGGFISIITGYDENEDLFLSASTAGKITNFSTGVQIGKQIGKDFIYLGGLGGSSSSSSAGYDAIVSDTLGYKVFTTLQDAINNVPPHGFILVEKLEELKSRVRTFGKTVNIYYRGYNTGLVRFSGQQDIQFVSFSEVPNRGTFRLEFKNLYTGEIQHSNDMPFNATSALVETEINLLNGHSGCSVTGDFTSGFTFTFADFIDLPLISFEDGGQNEIQRFNFSQVPDDGTCDFEFENNSGENHAFNDTPDQLWQVLFPLPNINDIDVRGSFDMKYYEIEFQGVDGLQNKSTISIVNSNLNVGGSGGTGGTEIEINGQLSSNGPVNADIVKEGRFPSHNLSVDDDKIDVAVTKTQEGIEAGPSKAIELDSHNNQIRGVGVIRNFDAGIDMSAYKGTRIEMHFENTELPLDGVGQYIGKDFNFDGSLGIKRDAFDAKPIYEVLEGTVDGVNTIFTSEYEPNTIPQFFLSRDGLMLQPDWYSVVGNVITINYAGAIPTFGQKLIAWYTPDILDFTPDIDYEPYFYENITGVENNFRLSLGHNYNRGSDRLEVYRNGIMMNLGSNVGSEVEKYQEISDTEIGLSLHCQLTDIYSAIFKDIRVVSKGFIVEKSNESLLEVPQYEMGSKKLRVFRNGLLLNNSSKGELIDQYSEVDSTAIGILVPTLVSDVFIVEVSDFNGTREDIGGLDNTKIVPLANSIESGKILVYRNGKLIHNSVSLGDTIDRYSVTNNFEIELGLEAQLTDYITVIAY